MHLPGPLRAAVGLVATAADEAKHLPDRAIELPMLIVSTALQASLRAQQRYARLAARGDEVLTRRTVSDEAPEWATFDEPLPVEELRRTMFAAAGNPDDGDDLDGVSLAESMVGSLFAVSDPRAPVEDAPDGSDPDFATARRDEANRRTAAAKETSSARKATGGTRAARKSTATKAAARASAATAPAAKTPARPVAKKPAKKVATKVETKAARKAARKAGEQAAKAPGTTTTAGAPEPSVKTVHKPRHTTPSAFDDVDDD